MKFIVDKFVDGLFIFIGVYFAFHFDQYQEDLALQRELKYNVQEIMRSLPAEKPLSLIRPFKIEQVKQKNNCLYKSDLSIESKMEGRGFLRNIKERGLFRFFEDKNLLRLMTSYYNVQLPNLRKNTDNLWEQYTQKVSKLLNESKDNCLLEAELKKVTSELSQKYIDVKVGDLRALHFGYYIKQKLIELGYESNKAPRYQLDINYITASTPELLKQLEDRKKRVFQENIKIDGSYTIDGKAVELSK